MLAVTSAAIPASALAQTIAAPAAATGLLAHPDGKAVHAAWQQAGFRFTPEVKSAWLAHAKAGAMRDLAAAGKSLPADFLAWIDSDPVVQATVYGARQNPANVLLMLRSLEIDLGQQVVREKYTQFCLALAVVHADKGPAANLEPRPPLQIVIPGDPRQPVDTKDPARSLDRDDHIINFLASNTIEEDVVIGHKEEPAPLKYDDKGIAIPPKKNAKPVKVPITEKRTRTLYAADVMASRAWQEKFNAYMKEHGQDVAIDCGDKVIHWKSTAAVRAERKKINEAFILFRTAYENKGLLPKARDAAPTPAESAAWLIRNDTFRFPEDTAKQRAWPKFPLTAPWPTLTMLAADNQPLREREERWLAFRDKGEMRTYGEYIGPIAQQGDMQSARRLTPFPYHYNTYQMQAKDGGVCGTMASMGVRTYKSLGIPACTAGQPGHCALILFAHDAKSGVYECRGGQFATGGPDKTSPHENWIFGDVDKRKPMIYYQSIAWAVNHGLQSYLDSTIAYQLFKALPDQDRKDHGLELLASAIALNPYNILLADAGHAALPTVRGQIDLWKSIHAALAGETKPGCPKDGLYNQTVRSGMFASLAKLPVPADTDEAREVLAFLRAENCTNAETLVNYQVAIDGLDAVVARTATAFQNHLGSARTEAACKTMADTMGAVAKHMQKKARVQWARGCYAHARGHENYLSAKNKILTDDAVAMAAKLAGDKLVPEPQREQPVLDQVAGELKSRVDGDRDPKSCAAFAARITTVAKQIKDPARQRQWLEGLAAVIAGKEEYKHKNGKTQRDPCSTTITGLLASPAPEKK